MAIDELIAAACVYFSDQKVKVYGRIETLFVTLDLSVLDQQLAILLRDQQAAHTFYYSDQK